jgi:hypothetical protein
MTHLTFAAVLLSATLTAAPEKAAAPAAKADEAKAAAQAAPKSPAAPKAAKPAKASKEAIKDAQASLLGPCSLEMATTKLKAVKVINGVAMNALLDEEKSTANRADPAALFMAVEYDTPSGPGKDYRQVNTAHHLTTEQAQALVGAPMCVFGKAP